MGARRRALPIGMQVIRSPQRMAQWSARLAREGVRIGLVPTMGALHAGHRSLIRHARLACDAVVVSLFVNPRQFGPREDFARYPRRARADAVLCRAEGVDVLFVPRRDAMYPPGFATSVSLPGLSRRWEGQIRPTHFAGVATVVTKLLSLIRPDVVYFGQKDYQQSVVVTRLVEDLNLQARVQVCPTVREPDGLAVSSRNEYLSPGQRRAAPSLHRGLQAGRRAIRAGVRDAGRIRRMIVGEIRRQPGMRIEYVGVADPVSLEPLRRVSGRTVLLAAVRMGGVRLLDNLLVTPGPGR